MCSDFTNLQMSINKLSNESEGGVEEEISELIRPFSKIEILCLTCVLEECLHHMNVLKEIMLTDALYAESSKTKSSKDKAIFLDCNSKLLADRDYIEEVLLAIQEELKKDGTYNKLLEAIPYEKQQNKILLETKNREKQIKKTVERLKEEIAKTTENTIKSLQEKESQICDKKNTLQKSKERIQFELEYMSNKSNSSIDQCTERITMKLDLKRKQLQEIKKDIQMEQMAHNEIINYLEKNINHLHTETEKWIEKQKLCNNAKEDLSKVIAEREKLQQELEKLISEYKTYKKLIEDEKNRKKMEEINRKEILKHWSALKIQKWWRNVQLKRKKKSGKKKGKRKAISKKK